MAVAKKLSFATASVIIYTFVLVKYIKNNLCIYKCSDSDTVGEPEKLITMRFISFFNLEK